LILKGTVSLPSNCVGAGIVTIDQLVNVLAERILSNHESGQAEQHVQEVLTIFPSLQFGMDVNPKFTAGPTGVEYTMHLNAFDLLHIELVHGWLLEPDAQEYDLIGDQSYNQLINMVIEGNDAATTVQNAAPSSGTITADHDALSTKATQGSIVKHFLDRSGHQLTQYGLGVLHEYLKDGQMVVFFRNNHFNTLTRHDGLLYLLVTDFGYANVSTVVWEKLDVIDGDTEYVSGTFNSPPEIREQMGAAASGNLQSQADYQLALQLSRENGPAASMPGTAVAVSDQDELQAAQQASLHEYNRANPDNPMPVIPQNTGGATSDSLLGSLGQQMNTLTETVRQAGTTIQDAASSMIQPAPAVSSTPVAARSQSASASNPSQQARLPATPTVAMGVPSEPPSQEQRDMMLALQLQRQEESERARRNTPTMDQEEASRNLAVAMQRKERASRKKRAARPAPPPGRLAMAPPSTRDGKDGNCVIS
jgi:hypothetical protein